MRMRRVLIPLVAVVVAGTVVTGYITRDHWASWVTSAPPAPSSNEGHPPSAEAPRMLKLSAQARQNLQLVSQPVRLETYWRAIQVPGVVIDRPGISDRGVPAPAVSVITKVHAYPGDTVKAGDPLFSVRLISEHLQNSQTELFKANREALMVQEQKERLKPLSEKGAIPEAKLVELDNQLRRLNGTIQAYRQDLLTRGLSPTHLDSVASGKFISEIEVVTPQPASDAAELVSTPPAGSAPSVPGPAYEVQELKVELGQQVQAGQTLCLLANHQSLYIEGHSFRREAHGLERAAQNGWPIRIEFREDANEAWTPLVQTFTIRHLANAVDPNSRTFSFYLSLTNQSRAYRKDGRTFLVWRFRPGQRVRLHVPVEELGKPDGKDVEKVIVLPAGALVREGPEAYVFRQNGDLFERRPVHVLYEDTLNVVLANDGALRPGIDYVAQGSASSLNRVLKAQNSGGGLPPGAHFHADGSLHIPGQ